MMGPEQVQRRLAVVVAALMAGCGGLEAEPDELANGGDAAPADTAAGDTGMADAAGEAEASAMAADAGDSAPGRHPSEAIYDVSTIATYALTVSSAGWYAICNDGAKVGDQWHRADLTWTSGTTSETISGVGVKRSGEGSRTMVTPKPAIRISFNEFEFAASTNTRGRKWHGVNRIKLDSMVGNLDKAMMRDRLAYDLFRAAGAVTPRSAYGRLYVNDVFKGLYEVEEPVRKDMLEYALGEDEGNLYSLGGEGWGNELPILETNNYTWRGFDPAAYIPRVWFAETNYPGGDYRDLVDLLNDINNFPAAEIRPRLESHINVDGFLRHLALVAVISDVDDLSHWAN